MRFKELVSEGPIDFIRQNWDKGADAADKVLTPRRWGSDSPSSSRVQKKTTSSPVKIDVNNKREVLAILNAVDREKISPSQQQLLDMLKNQVAKV
jgi:hypothetical protein